MIGIDVPIMIAFFKRCSCPLISFRSSGIDVKPRRANMITPIGVKKCGVCIARRFSGLRSGRNLMKIPRIIVITAMLPHVSTLFSPFSPRLSRSVMMSQKNIAKTTGGVSPGMSFARDSPSPIR